MILEIKIPETWQVLERELSLLEHMQVPMGYLMNYRIVNEDDEKLNSLTIYFIEASQEMRVCIKYLTIVLLPVCIFL